MNRFIVFILSMSLLCSCQEKEKPTNTNSRMRGVWLAAPIHNDMMHSYENLVKGLDELEDLNINTIFVVMWAEDQFGWKTEMATKYGDYKTTEEGWLYNDYNYKGLTEDPTKDLITLAHQRDMKVIFWFEFGFMAKWGAEPNAENSHFFAKNPTWWSKGNDGKFSVHNKTDFYYNAFHPDMQNFLLDIVNQSLIDFPEVDGVQADDRMPAMPINSGYDDYTIALYAKDHNGQKPPQDFKDPEWVEWRVNILNKFAEDFRKVVKSHGENKIVSFSPTVYPWSKENLMQDWPEWSKRGLVDLLMVQVYHTQNFKAYKEEFDENFETVKESGVLDVYVPGVLLGLSKSRSTSAATLDSILQYNSKSNIQGESYFYQKWLGDKEFNVELKKWNYLYDK